jgi:DNA-binding transcriptional ArsR family regulator
MLYVALCFTSDKLEDNEGMEVWTASATYDDLAMATDLSRSLIANGLSRLGDLNLVTPEGSHQKRRYGINWGNTGAGWFKLPCRAIVDNGVFGPNRRKYAVGVEAKSTRFSSAAKATVA